MVDVPRNPRLSIRRILPSRCKTARCEEPRDHLRNGDTQEALRVLKGQVQQKATSANIYFLLGEIYEKLSRPGAAKAVYQKALADKGLSQKAKYHFQTKLQALTTKKNHQ